MSHATIPLTERQHGPIPSVGARTDVGRMRDHNEDNFIVAPPLYAVADGMGGHEAGEVASEIAVNILAQQAPSTLDADALSNAVVTANYAILRAVEDGRGADGMGTTLTAAMVQGERLLIAQVGDSRAYLLHQSHLQQITRDHSLMSILIETGQITPEEAEVHPQRSVITRALGGGVETVPDIYELNVAAGDRLLLCSDGLSGMVSEEDLTEILTRFRDPQKCANQLIKRANMNGGRDNITAVVVDIEGDIPERIRRAHKSSRLTAGIVAFLLVAALAATAFGIHHWVTNSAYLAEYNGNVAIYQGVRGGFLGFGDGTLVEETTIKVDELNAGLAQRLKGDGVKADSVDDAKRLAQEYAEDAARNKTVSATGSEA
ncbi:MAG: Stp1/IreP family PP2C-type Ser/Thr phosphatase [Eggerthellales bacterium]|nr:Stp1/IreP family PP2C-type Ser/Thr phosphatase [Eggerthellales bacterium]